MKERRLSLQPTSHDLNNLPDVIEKPFPIFLTSKVIEGFGRGGKQLGIPTANMTEDVVNSVLQSAPNGIYFGLAKTEFEKKVRPMVMSLGWNPYFKNEKLSGEVHIIHNYQSDFYGTQLKVVILGFIRPEADFVDIETLVAEIQRDIDFCLKAVDKEDYKKYFHDKLLSH
ncbi:Riboflavin kinase [Smittium culicis]|uniref:Riboflavin kinase n=1 Tax=Smittium culicis TaxID=133412 RepID=A0A1R1Y7D1_9FUNG|nr:Riboflavin kinase [Smittium culicis]